MENSNDISKGGKRGEIGETRVWNSKRYKKTNDGWVPVGTDGRSKEKDGEDKPKKEKRMSNAELGKFIGDTFEEASEMMKEYLYKPVQAPIDNRDLISASKSAHKRLIENNKDGGDKDSYAFTFNTKDDEDGEVKNYGVKKFYTLKQIIKLKVGSQHFNMSKQQLKKFINS